LNEGWFESLLHYQKIFQYQIKIVMNSSERKFIDKSDEYLATLFEESFLLT